MTARLLPQVASPDDLISRARGQLKKNTVYRLGAGDADPSGPTARDASGACDCSGFVCWCLGIGRETRNPIFLNRDGAWIYTDSIVRDATSTRALFAKIDAPTPGCLVVYPSPPPHVQHGHIGIVTVVASDGSGNPAMDHVIHCSLGNFKNGGDAILETPPTVFRRPDAIFAWYIPLGSLAV